MKRALLPALMISLLLSGCGAAAEERIEARRDALAAAEEIRFTARIRANPGKNEAFDCVLDCAAEPGEVTVEVVEPAEIAGLRAKAAEDGASLEYEGVVLGLGGAAGGPLGAVPLLLRGLKSGHVIRAWEEDGGQVLAAELYADDDCELTLWFDADSLAPLNASISENGAEELRCEFENFSFH